VVYWFNLVVQVQETGFLYNPVGFCLIRSAIEHICLLPSSLLQGMEKLNDLKKLGFAGVFHREPRKYVQAAIGHRRPDIFGRAVL